MEKNEKRAEESARERKTTSAPADRKPWEEPKLAFVEPKLTRHGDLEDVTGKRRRNGFFGDFSP